MNDRPVFIAGLDRSGKTRMRLAVDAGASIAMARRGELWTHHLRRYGDLGRDDAARRAVDGVLADRHVAELVTDADALLRGLLDGPRTYAHLFALIGRQHADSRGMTRWGDQTALLERHADEIFDAFPGARVVHMIRDPRDRYASAMASGGIGRGGVGAAGDAWNESAALATRNEHRHAGRYHIIRFEDLALRPDETVARVLDVLDAEPGSNRPKIATGEAEVGIYRTLLSRRHVVLMQSLVADGMTRFGYAADDVPLGRMDAWRLRLLDRPRSSAVMWLRRQRRSHVRGKVGPAVSGRASS